MEQLPTSFDLQEPSCARTRGAVIVRLRVMKGSVATADFSMEIPPLRRNAPAQWMEASIRTYSARASPSAERRSTRGFRRASSFRILWLPALQPSRQIPPVLPIPTLPLILSFLWIHSGDRLDIRTE